MLLYITHTYICVCIDTYLCASVCTLVWSVSRSPLLQLPLLPHHVAVAAQIHRSMQQYRPFRPLPNRLAVCMSFALSVLSAPFACIFILKITQVADRQQQPRALCGNFGSLARNKKIITKEGESRAEKQKQLHVNFNIRRIVVPHNECCFSCMHPWMLIKFGTHYF